MIDLIDGKTVDDPMYTGLDECTKENVDTCVAEVIRIRGAPKTPTAHPAG